MERRSIKSLMGIIVVLTVLIALTGMAGVLQGVSPGAIDRFSMAEVACPTFSWQQLEGASLYELQVYALPEDFDLALNVGTDLETADLVLHAWLPGGSSSWTPPMERALNRGGRYAWFVRVASIGTDGEIDENGEWSEARLFSISEAPSVQEVESALEVLQRYVVSSDRAVDGERVLTTDRVNRSIAPSNGQRNDELPSTSSAPKSVLLGTSAIKGEIPDPSGETYGVVGISGSPDGAGIGAANAAGGPDLVLDGSTGGSADAELRESGIDRPAASATTFDITNSDAGSMTLRVDGINVVTTATDHDTLGGMVCSNGELARWNGSSWVCSSDTDTLATLACAADQVAKWNGASWICAQDDDTVYEIGPGLMLDGSVGWHSSLVIGADGLGFVGYRDETNHLLKTAHCSNFACTSALIALHTPEPGLWEGIGPSVGIGPDGMPLIAHCDSPAYAVKVTKCSYAHCGGSTTTTVFLQDPYSFSGTAMAIGADGLPLIALTEWFYDDLWVAHLPYGF